MQRGSIQIATCQFPISADIPRNAACILRQIDQAAEAHATVVHFPEAALSGYAGVDLLSWHDYDWETLISSTRRICASAAKRRIWIILSSAHQLSGKHLPHNSLYIIDPRGRIVDRYDKRFCTLADLKHYSPGDHFTVFSINGIRCGALICHDARYPELYRAYKKMAVQVIFHSFYNARKKGRTVLSQVMIPTLQGHAASNYIWISAANASASYQSWRSALLQPDGRIARSLPQHRSAVMVHTLDTTRQFYDACGPWTRRALSGKLNTGRLVNDPRSRLRTSY